jgi:hypothetical protein
MWSPSAAFAAGATAKTEAIKAKIAPIAKPRRLFFDFIDFFLLGFYSPVDE